MIDPLPGPRTANDFDGLHQLAPHVNEVAPATTTRPPAGSSLPRLAAELPARLVLLDPSGGAVGMATQIDAAAAYFAADDIVLVDVGGDALTDGADPGLRSPLADQLALAACVLVGRPARLVVTGAGLDGEIPAEIVLQRLEGLAAHRLAPIDGEGVALIRHVFGWHPSEASGMLAAAADGRRGRVEVRDAGDHVELTGRTAEVFAVDAVRAAAVTPATLLGRTTSLSEAEAVIRDVTGVSEIRYESTKANQMRDRTAHQPSAADLAAVDAHASAARKRGADFISARRLAELIGASSLDAYARLSSLLSAQRPDRFEPSLYRV